LGSSVLEHLRTAARRLLAGWVALAIRRPLAVVLIAAVLSVGSIAYTAQNLGIDTSTTEMIAPEVPFRRDAIEFRRAFPDARNPIVAVINGEVPELAEQAARALADALAADQTHFAAVRYTGGEPFFETHGLLYLSPDHLADLVDQLAAAQPLLGGLADDPSLRGLAEFVRLAVEEAGEDLPEELDRLFADAAAVVEATRAGEPSVLSWRSLLAGEEDAPPREIVLAEPRVDPDSLAPARDAIEAVRAAALAVGIAPEHGLSLGLTGPAVLDYEELQSVQAGAILAGGLTAVAVAGLLVWGLGSARLIAATLITLVCGLALTAGFATLAIGRLNLISVTFAVLFVGLGVDFGIHLALRYREAVERGAETLRALRDATLDIASPLSLSALCAALGFLSFVPTDYRGLAELGAISAGGTAIAWFASLTLMPAILALTPLRARPAAPQPRAALAWRPPIDRLRIPLLVVAVLAAIASAFALPSLRFDFNPLNLKDPETESVATFAELARDPRTSPYGIDILVPDLEEAQRVAARVIPHELVRSAVTLASFVPDHQDEKLAMIDDLAFMIGPVVDFPAPLPPPDAEERLAAVIDLRAVLEGESGAGAQELAVALDELLAADPDPALLAELDERLMGSLPAMLERLSRLLQAGPVGIEDLPASLAQAWVNPQGEARILVQPARPIVDNQELREFAAAVLDEVPTATGTPIVITEAGAAVITAFGEASLLAVVLITAVLALVLRSLRDVLAVLSPLALAVLLTGASAVVLDLQLNFANVIVLPLLLGLGVSGAIHVVMRRRSQVSEAALFASSTPRAVLFSALTTIASFGSLAVSPHRGMASMGQLLTIAILWSLVCTLLVLPALLSVLEARTRRRAAAAPAPAPPPPPAGEQVAQSQAAADPLHSR
jgi:uncharacterized protein